MRSGVLALLLALLAAPAAHAADLGSYVNVFAGTQSGAADFGTGGGAGNTFPGATVPFGMVQWSPDTDPSTDNFSGGYSYGDERIRGFSLTHLSGAGCAALRDVPFLPTTAPITRAPGRPGSSDVDPSYLASFSHADESARPGHYGVRLGDGTSVDLSATTRTGAARIGFPGDGGGSVLVNAGGSAMANGEAALAVDPGGREIAGTVESGRFCYQRNDYRVHFAAEFSRPFAAHGVWRDQALVPGGVETSDSSDGALNYTPIPGGPASLPGNPSGGAQAGAYVTFGAGGPVEVRVGVSYVSVDAARANLRAEGGGFEAVRTAAIREWDRALSRVHVGGGPKPERRTFYTMLYRSLLHPNVFSDADGRYRGMDGEVHQAGPGRTHYANFSGWDVYRTQIPLLAMLEPERASDIAASLVAGARESGCLPKWSLADGHTDVMVGDPADPAIASVHAFGARGFDVREALAAMVRGANAPCRSENAEYVQRQGLEGYLRLGYVPHEGSQNTGAATSMFGSTDAVWGSASTTLEYALADFSVGQLAAALRDPVASEFVRRGGNWRNVFDEGTGLVRPRSSAGAFAGLADPASTDGFVEGSSGQYTWLVPHDPAGLIAALGGREAALARLDEFFSELNAGPSSPHAFLGNEPNLHVPWLYSWLGRPDAAQRVVRRGLLELFEATPGGYPGNDDLGAMSAWYVLGALGLYPAIPGTDVLALGGPLFPRADLRLPGGTLRIRAAGAMAGRPYVKSMRRGGRPFAKPWLRFGSLICGGRLDFRMAGTPRPWGRDRTPPSFPPGSTPPRPAAKKC